jgi:CRP/FNR family transcriptional regulator, polysaccharide utilization system transcription regulator
MANSFFSEAGISTFFSFISQNEVDVAHYKKGQPVYLHGNTPLGVYVVKEGKVKVVKCGSCGKEQIVRIVEPGGVFSCSELLTRQSFKSTAISLEDTVLYFIARDNFRDLLKKYPIISEQFIIELSNELLTAEEKIATLSYKPVKARVAEALITLSNVGDDVVGISRKDLACFVGTAKETLNRVISEFKKDGLITLESGGIKIENHLKLKNYIE